MSDGCDFRSLDLEERDRLVPLQQREVTLLGSSLLQGRMQLPRSYSLDQEPSLLLFPRFAAGGAAD
jgi:hypothetical protein